MSSNAPSSSIDKNFAKGKATAIAGSATPKAASSIDDSEPDSIESGPENRFRVVFDTANQIRKHLDKLSNREFKEVLTMMASIKGLRVIPMSMPIGNSSLGTTRTATAAPIRSNTQKGVPPRKAPYKESPEWIELTNSRLGIVDSIKQESDSNKKQALVRTLRQVEESLKALRQTPAAGDC